MTKHLITIRDFWEGMMRKKSRTWYYENRHREGFPQPVMVDGGIPMLVKEECEAYVQRLIDRRDRAAPPPVRKRHPGRPAKQL